MARSWPLLLAFMVPSVIACATLFIWIALIDSAPATGIFSATLTPERERSDTLAREALRRVQDRLHPPMGDLPQRRPKQRIGLREAETLLGDFWHHALCDFSPTNRTHLFFYGSRKLDETGIVVLVTTGPADDQVVNFVTGEDNDRLFLYDDCSDLDLSVTKRERD